MIATISTDVFAIVVLCFTVYFAKRNIVINPNKNRIYIEASVTTIIILVAEIATAYMSLTDNTNFVIPCRIANMIGFSLCPAVPFILIYINLDIQKIGHFHMLLGLPLIMNTIVCILSFQTGWIYYVNDKNQYTHGVFFLFPIILCMIYFIIMIISILQSRDNQDFKEKRTMVPIIFVPMFGMVAQALCSDVLCVWASVAVALCLYYLFLREQQYKYDIQTGIKNRVAFEKDMEQCQKEKNNVIIMVLDINNFKCINDEYGHQAGDEVLTNVANIIRESFIGIGKAYRIGGDEFCVLCKEISNESMCYLLSKLEDSLFSLNEQNDIKVVIAYGFAEYNQNENKNIYTAFTHADKAMYQHKANLKDVQQDFQQLANAHYSV